MTKPTVQANITGTANSAPNNSIPISTQANGVLAAAAKTATKPNAAKVAKG